MALGLDETMYIATIPLSDAHAQIQANKTPPWGVFYMPLLTVLQQKLLMLQQQNKVSSGH